MSRTGGNLLERIKRIESVYAKLPKINCRKLCWESCGLIAVSRAERTVIKSALKADGKPYLAFTGTEAPIEFALKDMAYMISQEHGGFCPYLKERQCSIYRVRPFICRAFGVVEGLTCPFGCTPDRLMTREEFAELAKELDAIQ